MSLYEVVRRRVRTILTLSAMVVPGLLMAIEHAVAADPIRIGLSLSLTGPTSPAGKQVLAGLEIWRDDVNAKGGLLGRPVELVYYDDQGSPANAPGIYAKLMGVDKVDLLIGPYSTNVIAAAMPAIIQSKRTTIGIFGLGANKAFQYPRYFSMNSQGPSPANYSKCVFDLAIEQTPKPTRVALIGADVEYSRNALDGARENAKMHRPRNRVRADLSALDDRVHLGRAGNAGGQSRHRFRRNAADRHGGHHARSQRDQLQAEDDRRRDAGTAGHRDQAAARPADQRLHQQRILHSGAQPAVRRHQADDGRIPEACARHLASIRSATPIRHMPMRRGRSSRKAVSETKSFDDETLAAYIRKTTFDTVIGPISFGPDGEWTKPRIICIQFQGITGGDLDQFKDWSRQVVVYPQRVQVRQAHLPVREGGTIVARRSRNRGEPVQAANNGQAAIRLVARRGE